MKGKVFQAPTDTEGYAYKISMCTEIPNAQLPSGCQQYAEHPSVVKYKANNPADCIEIGSIGPCTQGECGMTGAAAGSGVTVTYTYTYGCKNTFAMTLTEGSDPAPGQVSSNECAYTVSWAGIGGSADAGGAGGAGFMGTPISGWLVVGILVFASAAYVGGGIGYNVKMGHHEKPGIEAIPNLEFWKQVPGLVKDGCILSYGKGLEFVAFAQAKATGKPYVKLNNAGGAVAPPRDTEKVSITKASEPVPDYGGAKE